MNACFSSRSLWLFFLGLGCLLLFVPVAWGADNVASGALVLHANAFFDIVSDRSRLIQVSLVLVVLGCAMLWWTK